MKGGRDKWSAMVRSNRAFASRCLRVVSLRPAADPQHNGPNGPNAPRIASQHWLWILTAVLVGINTGRWLINFRYVYGWLMDDRYVFLKGLHTLASPAGAYEG